MGFAVITSAFAQRGFTEKKEKNTTEERHLINNAVKTVTLFCTKEKRKKCFRVNTNNSCVIHLFMSTTK